MEILDETSQVLAYSRALEHKSRGARGGDRRAARGQRAAAGARPAQGRLRLHRHPRAAHAADLDPGVLRDSRWTTPTWTADEREGYLRIVVDETERLTRLINQVLDLAKLESGGAEWQIEDVDLRQVLDDVGAGDRPAVPRPRGRPRDGACPSAAPVVRADRGPGRAGHGQPAVERREVLPDPGRDGCGSWSSRATAAPCGSTCSDNGPGIAAEDQGVIFEKFRQGGDTGPTARRAPVWGCRSAGRSSITSAAGCGWRARPGRALRSPSTLPVAAVDSSAVRARGRADDSQGAHRRRRAEHRHLPGVPDEARAASRPASPATGTRRSPRWSGSAPTWCSST